MLAINTWNAMQCKYYSSRNTPVLFRNLKVFHCKEETLLGRDFHTWLVQINHCCKVVKLLMFNLSICVSIIAKSKINDTFRFNHVILSTIASDWKKYDHFGVARPESKLTSDTKIYGGSKMSNVFLTSNTGIPTLKHKKII